MRQQEISHGHRRKGLFCHFFIGEKKIRGDELCSLALSRRRRRSAMGYWIERARSLRAESALQAPLLHAKATALGPSVRVAAKCRPKQTLWPTDSKRPIANTLTKRSRHFPNHRLRRTR